MSRLDGGTQLTFGEKVLICVNVQSEVDALKSVIMRLANPYGYTCRMAVSILSRSACEQSRHNDWKKFNYSRARQQQQTLIQLLRDQQISVLLLDNVKGVNSQHYTRDIGFCIDDTFFSARMGTRYREPEQAALMLCCPALTNASN